MKNTVFAAEKIHCLADMQRIIAGWRLKNKTFAFTSGCFDLLHAGHINAINEAAKNADYLLVAIISDKSCGTSGGLAKINNEHDRALLLSNLTVVDAVVICDKATLPETIDLLKPDVLVKGANHSGEELSGADEVQRNGGRVIIHPILAGYSSQNTLARLSAK